MHSLLLYELFAWYCCRGFFSQCIDVMSFLQNNTYLETEQFSQVLSYLLCICGQPHHSCREEHWRIHAAAAHTGGEPMILSSLALTTGCNWGRIKGGNEERAKSLAAEPGKPTKTPACNYNALDIFTECQYIAQGKGAHWQSSAFRSRQKSSISLQAQMILLSAICLSSSLCGKSCAERGHCLFSQIIVYSRWT